VKKNKSALVSGRAATSNQLIRSKENELKVLKNEINRIKIDLDE
jgi:hypothetical protein